MEVVIGFSGVVLGFFLGAGYEEWKRYDRRRAMMKGLRAECEALIGQIPQFIDICEQGISELEQERVLAGPAVRAFDNMYRNHLAELLPLLKAEERSSLHVAYERLRVGDELIERQEEMIRSYVTQGDMEKPFESLAGRLEEQIVSYEVTGKLLRAFLDGESVDVFQVKRG